MITDLHSFKHDIGEGRGSESYTVHSKGTFLGLFAA